MDAVIVTCSDPQSNQPWQYAAVSGHPHVWWEYSTAVSIEHRGHVMVLAMPNMFLSPSPMPAPNEPKPENSKVLVAGEWTKALPYSLIDSRITLTNA